MVYIPIIFLNNKDNLNKVSEILSKLDTDIKHEGCYSKEDAIKELEELKEDIIIEKFNNGFFNFGA